MTKVITSAEGFSLSSPQTADFPHYTTDHPFNTRFLSFIPYTYGEQCRSVVEYVMCSAKRGTWP